MSQLKLNLSHENKNTLNSLYQLYRLGQNLNDTVRQLNNHGESQLLWSTAFTQAFSACQILSKWNWFSLLSTKELKPWSVEKAEDLTSADKMKDMVIFCYNVLGDKTPAVFGELLARKLKNTKDPLAILGTKALEISTAAYQDNFHKRFQQIIEHRTKDADEYMLLVYKLLRFIFSVRENMFKGLTLITSPMDEFMPARFEIYSEILLASCELLFYTIEQISDWHHRDFDVLNTDVHDLQRKEEARLRNIGRRNILKPDDFIEN